MNHLNPNTSFVVIVLFLCFTTFVVGQNVQRVPTYDLTLDQTIALAQSDAPDVLLAETNYTTNYWVYQRFLADYKPNIDLNGTFPNLNRSIEPITLPDGRNEFISRSLMSNELSVSLRQNITATGGSIFASTGLQRIDIFKTSIQNASQSYLSTPINIGFQQPLFAFNPLKWNKLIEPIRFEENQRAYSEQMEDVAYDATRFFFDVLSAQLNVAASERQKANADTLLEVGKGRFSVGKIAETELLQLELTSMRTEADLAAANLLAQTTAEALRNFLGIKEVVRFNLIPPEELYTLEIDAEEALKWAKNHRSQTITFRRRLAEAERNIAQAKGERFNVEVVGVVGLTQTGTTFSESYQNPLDQERVRIGVNVPIADWGKSRAQMEIAKSQKALTELNIELDQLEFDQEITIKVQQFELVKKQVNLADKTYLSAQKRLDLTQKRYLIGKIGITDLNIAIGEQENARRAYVSALQSYWIAYYELRGLTLYDFKNKEPLILALPK